MKLLFVNHAASRTGAPIVLLHFLNWLKDTQGVAFDVLSLENGELLEAFTKVSHTHYFERDKNNLSDKLTKALKHKFGNTKAQALKYPIRKLNRIAKNNYDLIYANTVVSVPVACYLKKMSNQHSKLLVNFHELNLTIHRHCPQLDTYKDTIDHSIAVSNKVKDNLLLNWGFEAQTIDVVYECSKVPDTMARTTKEFIVGASGQVDWRKGPDFFIMVADYVHKKLPNAPIIFQWVGKISRINRLVYEEDVKKLNLQGTVEFIGVQERPHDFFSNFDVFLMTSKEDPFPLVCIEIGMMGIPMVCFEGATGTEEVLKDVQRSVVPYMDVAAMGERVLAYYANEHLKVEVGQTMKHIFNAFSVENQSEKLHNVIKHVIANEA